MGRRLPQPRTAADEYAAALHDRLGELLSAVGDVHQLLRDRLPSPREVEPVTGPVRLTEPHVPTPPQLPEPEPDPVRLTEPDPPPAPGPEPKTRPLPPPPPRAGRGSSLPAWQEFADAATVPYGPDDKRDDIIAACERAGVIPVQEG